MNDKNIGVIQEQGFVAGNNLGFKPLTEAEKKAFEKQFEEKDSKK